MKRAVLTVGTAAALVCACAQTGQNNESRRDTAPCRHTNYSNWSLWACDNPENLDNTDGCRDTPQRPPMTIPIYDEPDGSISSFLPDSGDGVPFGPYP